MRNVFQTIAEAKDVKQVYKQQMLPEEATVPWTHAYTCCELHTQKSSQLMVRGIHMQ